MPRTVWTDKEVERLIFYFQKDSRPSASMYSMISDELGRNVKVIRTWFCNQRTRARKATNASSVKPLVESEILMKNPLEPEKESFNVYQAEHQAYRQHLNPFSLHSTSIETTGSVCNEELTDFSAAAEIHEYLYVEWAHEKSNQIRNSLCQGTQNFSFELKCFDDKMAEVMWSDAKISRLAPFSYFN